MSRDDKIAAIKACVAANMTTREMADEFRTTRNSVIGFASRNNVQLLSAQEARPKAGKKERKPKAKKENVSPRLKISRPKLVGKRDVKFAIAEPELERAADEYVYRGPVDMDTVNSRTCRSPLWADGVGRLKDRVRLPEIQFCGKPVKEGSPYCPECHGRHYTPAEPPKKRPRTDSPRRLEW